MQRTLSKTDAKSQSATSDPTFSVRSVETDLDGSGTSAETDLAAWLVLLRQAMDDTKWTAEQLDALWGTSRGYANRLCTGVKPWSVARQLSLPRDLRRRLRFLEGACDGQFVVEHVDEETAERYFAIALFSKFGRPTLPAKASVSLKADLRVARKQALG